MVFDNYSYVYAALRILARGLQPFVEERFRSSYGAKADTTLEQTIRESVQWQSRRYEVTLDVEALLAVMNATWDYLFRPYFRDNARTAKAWVIELQGVRGQCAHPAATATLSDEKSDHAFSTIIQLLSAVQAAEADEVRQLRTSVLIDPTTHGSPGKRPPVDEPPAKLKLADAVWIGTALLHREHPDCDSFAVKDIVSRVDQERLYEPLPPGIQIHASSHNVASKSPSPDKHRMLSETEPGRRRLFRNGDTIHAGRNGKIVPNRHEIPERYAYLLDWYDTEYDR